MVHIYTILANPIHLILKAIGGTKTAKLPLIAPPAIAKVCFLTLFSHPSIVPSTGGTYWQVAHIYRWHILTGGTYCVDRWHILSPIKPPASMFLHQRSKKRLSGLDFPFLIDARLGCTHQDRRQAAHHRSPCHRHGVLDVKGWDCAGGVHCVAESTHHKRPGAHLLTKVLWYRTELHGRSSLRGRKHAP